MQEHQILVAAFETLPDAFALVPTDEELVHVDYAALLNALRDRLAGRITEMLDRDRYRLMSLLYRIDVREHHVKAALAAPDPGHIPFLLADLIIDRQLEKIRIRRHYAARGA